MPFDEQLVEIFRIIQHLPRDLERLFLIHVVQGRRGIQIALDRGGHFRIPVFGDRLDIVLDVII